MIEALPEVSVDVLPQEEVEAPPRIHILGTDTFWHAFLIRSLVQIPGVRFEIISEREEFGRVTEVPESVPQGNVLISIDTPSNKTIELFGRMTEVLTKFG